MKKRLFILTGVWLAMLVANAGDSVLERGFADPPRDVRLHAYWWWLNGHVTREAITRDLEAMRDKGFGGALIMDAGGAEQDGNRQIPKGPLFGSDAWRDLYRHALREAARLHMELALNIQSGWNLGGPHTTAEDAAKIFCWTETRLDGPMEQTVTLAPPVTHHRLLREVAVLALPDDAPALPDEMKNRDIKTLMRPVSGANGPVAGQLAATPGGMNLRGIDAGRIIDLTGRMAADGKLTWAPPAGSWKILRFCYTVSPSARVSTCSQGWEGLALDPMDADAFQRYWDDTMEPLMADARQIEAGTLRYLHTDSWEIEPYNWTSRMPTEFRQRRGYDMTPWLPVLAGSTVGNVAASERFLHDFRKTVAELTAENYYGPFLKNAHRHGLRVRAESGGPHGVPIDAQHCLGMIDVPMSEFWSVSWRHRVGDLTRFFVKQPASAAHTYGSNVVAAEGFTNIGPHWQESVWENLKPTFDRALCEGLNQLVWTLVTCSPKEMGQPGQEMFPGTHFNPNSTWWRQSEGFLSYINRCQWLLRQGRFVADVLYYYGDLAPNFAGLKASNPAHLPPGYGYDVASDHVLLQRVAVKDGRIILPDGMSYGALVLPPHPAMSLPVLRKLRELADAGAVIIGPRPDSSSGLMAWQSGDAETMALIHQLWGETNRPGPIRYETAAAWLKSAGLAPDFEVSGASAAAAALDDIHRRADGTDIYFIANLKGAAVHADCVFRVNGMQAELWDPVTGERGKPAQAKLTDGRVRVPLDLDSYGSMFVVFRNESSDGAGRQPPVTSRDLTQVAVLKGPWELAFDPEWFYPDRGRSGKLEISDLIDWSRNADDAVRYFSGCATYRKTFEFAKEAADAPLFLSLGMVREMARVRVNGHDLGVVWCPPWRVRLPAEVLTKTGNKLEIEVVNFWPNRLIGDAKLPPEQRRTRTNITKFENPNGDVHYTTLMPAGLLGPVTVQAAVVGRPPRHDDPP